MVKAQTMRKRKKEEEDVFIFIIIFSNNFNDDDTDADKKRSYDLMCRKYPVNRILSSPDVGASFFARACARVCVCVCDVLLKSSVIFLRVRVRSSHWPQNNEKSKKVTSTNTNKHATTTKKKASKCCGRKREAIRRVFTRE